MKHIVITGGSGGIGGAVAKRFLAKGWHIHLLLRSFKSPAVQEMMLHSKCSVYLSDPEHTEQTLFTIQSMKNDGIVPDLVFHAAGTFLWDDGFPGELKRPAIEVREILFRSNVKTKESVMKAVASVYTDTLSTIEQACIGSHAANFAVDGPERTGKYTEEFYVEMMSIVQTMAHNMLASGIYKDVFLFEPGLVNTEMAQKAFPEERIGFLIDWSTAPTPVEYAEEIFPSEFFTTRQ